MKLGRKDDPNPSEPFILCNEKEINFRVFMFTC